MKNEKSKDRKVCRVLGRKRIKERKQAKTKKSRQASKWPDRKKSNLELICTN